MADSVSVSAATADTSGMRQPRAIAGLLFWPAVLVMLITQAMQQWFSFPNNGTNILHVWVAGVIAILAFLERKGGVARWVFGAISMVAFFGTHWYLMSVQDVIYLRTAFPSDPDLIAAVAIMLLLLFYSWYSFGWSFAGLAVFFVAYPFVAQFLPGPLEGPGIPTVRIMARFLSDIHGPITGFATQFIWLLLFWGMLLTVAGADVSVSWLANKMAKRFTSGPAMACLVSSAFVASFTGAGPNAAAITGPVTIPAMVKAGYPRPVAAAIESVATEASGMTPPVLGTVAFIMADFLGMSYAKIMAMCIIPAVLWYVSTTTYIVGYSAKNKAILKPLRMGAAEEPATGLVLRSTAIAVIPVGILIYMVIENYTLRLTTAAAFLSTMALGLTLRVNTDWGRWRRGIRDAGVLASAVTVTIAILSIVADVIQFTGLGLKFGDLIEAASGGSIFFAGLIMVAIGILLGGPLPPLPIYFIMVLAFGPVLARMGVPLPVTHFVAFYMGMLGSVTLPVAASALITSVIAGSSYWETGVQLLKMVWPRLVLPLVFVFAPELLLVAGGPTDLPTIAWALLITTVAYGVSGFASGGWFFGDLSGRVQWIVLALSVAPFVGIFLKSRPIGALGLGLIVLFVIYQFVVSRRRNRRTGGATPVEARPAG